MPKEVVAQMNSLIYRALQESAVRKNMEERGIEVIGGTPAKFGDHLQNEIAKYARIVKTSNMKID